jgi:hypothetical protein
MVNLNRQIGISRAQQGGFSAHVLPGPVSYAPVAADWGMGWLFTNDPLVGGSHSVTTVTGISGDGSSSASFTVDSGGLAGNFGRPQRVRVLPVYEDVFIVVLYWRIRAEGIGTFLDTGNFGDVSELIDPKTTTTAKEGWGKRGLLLSRTQAQQITIPDAMGAASPSNPDFLPLSAGDDNSFNVDQFAELVGQPVFDAQGFFPTSPSVNNFPLETFLPTGSGSRYGDATPDGRKWRISLASDSGFARTIDEVPLIVSANEGSVWFTNYNAWDGLVYRLERETSADSNQWEPWSDGIGMVASPFSITPQWTATIDEFNSASPSTFFPLISVPFTDRRQFFKDEFDFDIS